MSPNLEIVRPDLKTEADISNDLLERLKSSGAALAEELAWIPNTRESQTFSLRTRKLGEAYRTIFQKTRTLPSPPVPDDFRWLYDNSYLLQTELPVVTETLPKQRRTRYVRNAAREVLPRTLGISEGYLKVVAYRFKPAEFIAFIEGFQRKAVLDLNELSTLILCLKLTLLEQIATRAQVLLANPTAQALNIGDCIKSLRDIGHAHWRTILDGLLVFDGVLRQDPRNCYGQMDAASRDAYQKRVARIARYSDASEMEVAEAALALARASAMGHFSDPRLAERESHVGYYLMAEGANVLQTKVGYRPPLLRKIQAWTRNHPDDVLPIGVSALIIAIMSPILFYYTDPRTSFPTLGLQIFLLLLVVSQSAVELMNYLITVLLRAEILPKIEFQEGIPEALTTLVAVPCLLINEKQVRGLVDDLEIRYLGNHDPHLHFALLSDMPDSHEAPNEDDPLVDLASTLIRDLNTKYAAEGSGGFLLLHRHRAYNHRERVWMGSERKRGKLMDLNKLLRNEFDSFPVKVGDLTVLPRVRFVITLDSDTELPRGSAERMVGTLAHPLNRAVIDPEKNIVSAGYGILQPRVAISVQSTSKSRLASIYAGETGLDIYTRAISDAYQDLYGEGIFTGKGIYEVDAVHRVLDRRFPNNALLSHDLIEGAYARVGLVSDVEVIEDYPSRYSAHSRRKHRWLRGDWQITGWLFSQVQDEAGNWVENPLTLVSTWKILDNLRRSLVEPATFFLLLLVWLAPSLPPVRWTTIIICVLFVPSWAELLVNLTRAAATRKAIVARDALNALITDSVNKLFKILFLAHQTLLSLDAVVRAVIRRTITRHRLLEWETAAEAEIGNRRAPVDVYLDWTPALAITLAVLLAVSRPWGFIAAAPILCLWACSKLIAEWLDGSPLPPRKEMSRRDLLFLRSTGLRTWRYFAAFSNKDENWLIPDNVQENPLVIASRVSPTNLGLLLNARQAAVELGYLTVPEMAELTLKSLDTFGKLEKFRGHLVNWYDTRTLAALKPRFVSSVDSGNLVASLWTLHQGCIDLLKRPVIEKAVLDGVIDLLKALVFSGGMSRKEERAIAEVLRVDDWLTAALQFNVERILVGATSSKKGNPVDAQWFASEARQRIENVQKTVRDFMPWCLPEFKECADVLGAGKDAREIPLGSLGKLIERLREESETRLDAGNALHTKFREALGRAAECTKQLAEDLRRIAITANPLADGMEFGFLLNPDRKMLSVGFDVEKNELQSSCYDLLASEARTAALVAIAKEDIDQETWFLLGRAHTLSEGQPVIISWTGTMFEYLMPSLWMRSYPNTLLDRARIGVVRSQQAFASANGVPWGISESAFSKTDDAGNYQYRAFGIPGLALHREEEKFLVIAPYATFLSLGIDPESSLQNLVRMADMGFCGSYGYYDAVDYTGAKSMLRRTRDKHIVVKCWMAHHEGMALLGLANFLTGDVFQRFFHNDRRIQATELLLHERPVGHVPSSGFRSSAA